MSLQFGRPTVSTRTIAWAIAAICMMPLGSSGADETSKYPDRPIRIIVGFSAGSAADLASRIVGEKLTELLESAGHNGKSARCRRRSCGAERGQISTGRLRAAVCFCGTRYFAGTFSHDALQRTGFRWRFNHH